MDSTKTVPGARLSALDSQPYPIYPTSLSERLDSPQKGVIDA